MLVHSDFESAGEPEVADMEYETDVTIPHVPGVSTLHCLLQQETEVLRVIERHVGKGGQHGITDVVIAGKTAVSPIIRAQRSQ